jgi:Spy/CpxP family protein refolding chaperone
MFRTRHVVVSVGIMLTLVAALPANAQQGGGGWGRVFQIPAVTLAQLKDVQEELKLTDEQKEEVAKLNDKLNEDRRELFQSGDREQFREKWTKINSDASDAFEKLLDDDQAARAQEIYVQVNGPAVLADEKVAGKLELSDEQKEALRDVMAASRETFMGAGLRDMDREAAAAKIDELMASRDEKLLEVLTDDQRAQFEKMQGEAIEVDLSELPRPGRS